MTVPAWVTVLRRLAGRLPDDDLAALRSTLGAGEVDDLERSLLFALADHRVGIDDTERALLAAEGVRVDSPVLADLPAPVAADTRFRPEPSASTVDEKVLAATATLPTVRRVLRARRLAGDKLVYVVELTGGSVPTAQAALHWGLDGALLEVVLEGEDLPPYQAAARSAGVAVATVI
ncbi:hypothetical protein [Actinokineospora globicatena]|uniref:hypothetical protein n=1 Tax=Actinokineospora globicatena TaxID=103729 RepID=UPI0020A26345|nr:hypothetical protein [Actinokineospora globicatena]GLW78106.1 hypothetical protein Aglo01_25880 [Actinokineospora globicatena]